MSAAEDDILENVVQIGMVCIINQQEEEIKVLSEQVKVLRKALGSYAECCDGCTCGDGWSHDIAIEALEQTKPKGGE